MSDLDIYGRFDYNKTMETLEKEKKDSEIKKLRAKAAIFDELLELIEDKYLGYMMGATEKEKGLSLVKAKRMLRG